MDFPPLRPFNPHLARAVNNHLVDVRLAQEGAKRREVLVEHVMLTIPLRLRAKRCDFAAHHFILKAYTPEKSKSRATIT